ncbi:MAG: hypothetical protein AMXMBFR58_07390 [Phycisphaerae bacterium]
MQRDELESWTEALERARDAEGWTFIRRVMSLRQTKSTQDAAVMLSGGKPGMLVTAGHQTAGRGRLGRSWADTSHMGVAVTVTIRNTLSAERLSLAGGLASCRAVEQVLGPVGAKRVGIRWPNDVVEAGQAGPGRKLSGVLIEVTPAITLMGIGINVLQQAADWPEPLAGRAVSLRELGCTAERVDVLVALARCLDQALQASPEHLALEWQDRNLLTGTLQTFIQDGKRVTGTVLGIDPACSVRVQCEDGRVMDLPALTTSMEK